MKINLKIIGCFIGSLIFTLNSFAIEDDYPLSKEEREAKEIGSIVGSEGLVFRPGKIKNESTKAVVSSGVNKYLWQASIETLNFAPLASADSAGGIIITDWYTPKGKANYSFKINVLIKNNTISPDSIEVKVFERLMKNGSWTQSSDTSSLAHTLENKILRHARDLYIQAEPR